MNYRIEIKQPDCRVVFKDTIDLTLYGLLALKELLLDISADTRRLETLKVLKGIGTYK